MIALPPLLVGDYDIILDENQNGIFSGGAYPDYVLGNGPSWAFRVLDYTIGTGIDAAEIKEAAFNDALMWAVAGDLMNRGLSWGIDNIPDGKAGRRQVPAGGGAQFVTLFTTVRDNWLGEDILHEYVLDAVENPPDPPEFEFHLNPVDYYKDYLMVGVYMIAKACHSQVEVYYDIYNDPPDPDYENLVVLPSVSYQEALGPGKEHRDHLYLANTLREQENLGIVLRQSLEKFQGAGEVQDYYWARIHNESLLHYAKLFRTSLDSSYATTARIKSWIEGLGIGEMVHNGELAAMFRARVDSSGFTEDELLAMDAAGMTSSEVETLRVSILNADPEAFDGMSLTASLDSLQVGMAAMTAALGEIITDCEAMRQRLQNVWINHPTARITAPENAPEGTTVPLSASESSDPQGGPLTFAWDLDADGLFDDDTGVEITPTWLREQALLIGLEVTDNEGLKDVDYARLLITDVNDGPFFVATSPESVFVQCDSLPILFEVSVGDPESDPVACEWYVDGEPTGVTDLNFTWDLVGGVHTVWADISDGSPLSPDNRWVWRLRAESSGLPMPSPTLPDEGELLPEVGPNPFWNRTKISLDLDRSVHLRAAIYDVAGRRIRMLADGHRDPGSVVLTWNGRNEQGRAVRGGVYYCRIEVDGSKLTRRVLLIR
jgi:hypothetical protein